MIGRIQKRRCNLNFSKNFTPLSTDEAKNLVDKLSESIDYYISLGIDVNHHERNPSGEAWTPLFYAVKYEDPQMTERYQRSEF